jgi:hypothetical protein
VCKSELAFHAEAGKARFMSLTIGHQATVLGRATQRIGVYVLEVFPYPQTKVCDRIQNRSAKRLRELKATSELLFTIRMINK